MGKPQSPPSLERIGAEVRRRRKDHGMTQTELAELAGVGLRFVSEMERGKATLRADRLLAVLRVFGWELGLQPLTRESLGDADSSEGESE